MTVRQKAWQEFHFKVDLHGVDECNEHCDMEQEHFDVAWNGALREAQNGFSQFEHDIVAVYFDPNDDHYDFPKLTAEHWENAKAEFMKRLHEGQEEQSFMQSYDEEGT